MAKRKKEEKDAPIKLPEFDEVEFMEREIAGAKASVATIAYAIPVAVLSFLITLAGVPIVAFFGGIGLGFLLYYVMPNLPVLRIDTSRFKRRDWAGHGVTFFFSWLAFWILLLNAPFGDFTAPTIASVTVSTGSGDIACPAGDTVPVSAGNVTVNATVGDNVGLSRVTIEVGSTPVDMTRIGGSAVFQYRGTLISANYELLIRATDPSGHQTTHACTVSVT